MGQNKLAWTFGITTTALFMTALDNLVVVTAIPAIQKDLARRWASSSGSSTRTHSPSRSCS